MDVVVPSPRAAAQLWKRNARVFSHIWKGALLPLFFDPLFYLVALGFGLGTYLAEVNGIPYKEFIAPGLCASAGMWAASFETTWNAFWKMNESRQYDAVIATPVEPEDVVLGEVLWAATRALVDLATGPELLAVLGNGAWLLVVTVVLFFLVPVRAMRRRLVS